MGAGEKRCSQVSTGTKSAGSQDATSPPRKKQRISLHSLSEVTYTTTTAGLSGGSSFTARGGSKQGTLRGGKGRKSVEVSSEDEEQSGLEVPSLLNLAAKSAAQHFAFEAVEERYTPIPEPVQKAFLFWSFPKDEFDIFRYTVPVGLTSTGGASALFNQQQHYLSRILATTAASTSSDPLSPDSPVATSSITGNNEDSNNSSDFPGTTLNPLNQSSCNAFTEGSKLIDNGCVEEALQIGFHLTGIVRSIHVIDGERKLFKIAINFDRCKITSIKCSCDNKDIHWCQHAVAVCLYRIRFPQRVKIRLPISETLCQMDRGQLQKMVQYLISEHYTDILPTAQLLADELAKPESDINRIHGAPDPTAGPDLELEHRWFLDEKVVSGLVNTYLSHTSSLGNVNTLLMKVREMLHHHDKNGPRLLKVITEQIINYGEIGSIANHPPFLSEKRQHILDQIRCLWVSVISNPSVSAESKADYTSAFRRWACTPSCPPEIPETVYPTRSDSPRSSNSKRKRTIFSFAIEAAGWDWDDPHLGSILHESSNAGNEAQAVNDDGQPLFDHRGRPLWQEDIPVACSRIECLTAHGHLKEALNLSVAVFRTLRYWQSHNTRKSTKESTGSGSSSASRRSGGSRHHSSSSTHQHSHHHSKRHSSSNTWRYSHFAQNYQHNRRERRENNELYSPSSLKAQGGNESSSMSVSRSAYSSWIGHPLNPINKLFDTLITIPSILEQQEQGVKDTGAKFLLRNDSRSYTELAAEAALIALGQMRKMPESAYGQHLAIKQEKCLIDKLKKLNTDPPFISVITRQAKYFLRGCRWPTAGKSENSILYYPMHLYGSFLFQVLLNHEQDLAYQVGIHAMNQSIRELEGSDGYLPRDSFWSFSCHHIEGVESYRNQQAHLASALLIAAKDSVYRLNTVLTCIQSCVKSPALVYRLAQEVERDACTQGQDSPARHHLLTTAVELGLQVLKMTQACQPWAPWARGEMVRWLVNCASTHSLDTLMSLVCHWHQYFLPTEASGTVAPLILHDNAHISSLRPSQKQELTKCIHRLALECVSEDPGNCSLDALTLCENDPMAFEQIYNVVYNAAQLGRMQAPEIFKTAKHMNIIRQTHRALDFSLLGLSLTFIGYNEENSPLVADINWAVQLAMSMGKAELAKAVRCIVRNVKCAPVLSDLLGKCFVNFSPNFSLNPLASSGSTRIDLKETMESSKPIHSSSLYHHGNFSSQLDANVDPLRALLDAAIAAYVNTTQSRLTNISPRQYTEFINFLTQAQETFHLAQDGPMHFSQLIENMKMLYKGKKKLIALITKQFG